MSLAELNVGESACIIDFRDKLIYIKMLELGCLPGEVITLERKAPLGDPIIIKTKGGRISLRKSEAATIQISQRIVNGKN